MRKPSTSSKGRKTAAAPPAVPAHREAVQNIPVHRIREDGPVPTHRIRADAADAVDGGVVVTAYAWGGGEVDPAAPDALAKKSHDPATGRTRYWLKRATAGADRGHLFNPQSPTFFPGVERRVHDNMGRGQYEFKPATQDAFDLYLKFITHPHNPLNLRGAERCN